MSNLCFWMIVPVKMNNLRPILDMTCSLHHEINFILNYLMKIHWTANSYLYGKGVHYQNNDPPLDQTHDNTLY